jgi:ribosome modulation factor
MEVSLASPHDRAWSEGHKAGKNKQDISSSPYKKGMMQVAWMQGWQAGVKTLDSKDA